MFAFPVLAHGSLGIWDETIFIMVAAVFLFLMGASWFRSRLNAPPPDAPTQPPPQPDSPDYTKLD